MASSAPAGWPRDLPAAGTAEFGERVSLWLLDRGPADLRGTALSRLPAALGIVVGHYLDGAIEGLRTAYAQARREMAEVLGPHELLLVLTDLEAEGARLVQVRREVALVTHALREEPARDARRS